MICKSDKLIRADAILALILAFEHDGESLSRNWYVDCYANGREQGYALVCDDWGKNGPTMICFSEYRNTDSIVIYVGGLLQFSMQGHVPNQDVYAAKFFADSEPKAAQIILREMIKRDGKISH